MLKVYAVLYSLMIALAFIDPLLGGELGVGVLFSWFFGTIYCVGLWGYILNKAIFVREIWKASFYLNCIGMGAILLTAALVDTSTETIVNLLTACFMIPSIIVFNKYGDKNYPIWFNQDELEKGKVLSGLFKESNEISVKKDDLGSLKRNHFVCVTKDDGSYTVKIQRVYENGEQEYSDTFKHLAAVIKYIEKHTIITIDDLATPSAIG